MVSSILRPRGVGLRWAADRLTDSPAASEFAVLFLAWAFVPTHTLHAYGITYYPSKHWPTALPVWCCLAVAFAYIVYER